MAHNPVMVISGSEPLAIQLALEDISVVDHTQLWPDYLISSKQGYTVGIARAAVNDLLSNKLDIASHIAGELNNCHTDVRIFLQEEWLGRTHDGKISLHGNQHREINYVAVTNLIMTACIATNSF